jgi:tetratricopeptide (TPR) repeat protein
MTVLQQSAPPPATESQETTFQVASPRPRKFRWMWVALVVLLSLCCLIFFWATRNRGIANIVGPSVPSTPTEAQMPFSEPVTVEQMDIEQARTAAEENPDDPQALLMLGVALLDAGDFTAGYSEIHNAANLAVDDERTPFLLGAGRALQGRRQWLAAAIMFHRAYEQNPIGLTPVAASLLESIYFAYEDPRAPQYLEFGDLADSGEYFSLFAQARYTLVNRSPADAERLVARLLVERPRAADAGLLQAQLLAAQGQKEQALAQVDQLLQRQELPEWVKTQAELLRSQLR